MVLILDMVLGLQETDGIETVGLGVVIGFAILKKN